jgi:hypothetical protein
MPAPHILATAAASGGRSIVPATPSAVWHSFGVFRVTDYNANFVYTMSNASRTNDLISVNGTNASSTIIATAPKGLASSGTRTVSRQPITYSNCNCYCGLELGGSCAAWYCSQCPNPTPGGWQSSGNEWYRIV